MKKINQIVQENMSLIEPYLLEDGSIPPTLFFNFKTISPKISELMNRTTGGKTLEVVDGFFFSLADEVLSEKREEVLESFAVIFAMMRLLKILDELESVTMVMEAYQGDADKGRPSKNPDAKVVFIGAGIDKNNKSFIDSKDILYSVSKNGSGDKFETSLAVAEQKFDANDVKFPGLELFWKKYKEVLVSAKEDGSYKMFLKDAKENPVETLAAGLTTAIHLVKMS